MVARFKYVKRKQSTQIGKPYVWASVPTNIVDKAPEPSAIYKKPSMQSRMTKNNCIRVHSRKPLLSAIIPTLNEATNIESCLDALIDGADEIIIADGGSSDNTASIASGFNVHWIETRRSRGAQLAAGGIAANGEWLMFVHADTVLEAGWQNAVSEFIKEVGDTEIAGVFSYRNDLNSLGGKALECCVAWRTQLGLPYGDQCLLIGRKYYDRLGGFMDLPIMEDVELIRRIGRRRLRIIEITATTSGSRYKHGGIFWRSLRNIACLALYFAGLPPRLIVRLYG